jgi:hypothetical protein
VVFWSQINEYRIGGGYEIILVEHSNCECLQQRAPEEPTRIDTLETSHDTEAEDRKDGRRFPVSPFTRRAGNDHNRNGGFQEGLNYQLVHLAAQRLVGDFWIWLHHPEKYRSTFGIRPYELDYESGEDELEIAPILEVSGAEGGVEQILCEHFLHGRLGG